jgi:hypothetical protein
MGIDNSYGSGVVFNHAAIVVFNHAAIAREARVDMWCSGATGKTCMAIVGQSLLSEEMERPFCCFFISHPPLISVLMFLLIKIKKATECRVAKIKTDSKLMSAFSFAYYYCEYVYL